MPNFTFGTLGIEASTLVAPNNAAIGVSDYCAVSQTSERVRFERPISDGQGYEHTNPGARVRFATNSAILRIWLKYTALVTRIDVYNGFGKILVDGAAIKTFNKTLGEGDVYSIMTFPGDHMRTFEVVMPFCAAVDFMGVYVVPGATVQAAPARPAVKYACLGESPTHGFYGTTVTDTFAYKVGILKGWQVLNVGYGSHRIAAADGTALGNLAPTVASILIGANDCYGQVPLATTRSRYLLMLQNFRGLCPGVKLYCFTPTWLPTPFGPILIEEYRQQIRDVVAELADPLIFLFEGESLGVSDVAYWPDYIHPNDAGHALVANSIAAILTV